jgi:coenzyme F420-0:L-glutamate ligase/coenzyme F420-1:gamma-L-glutamate ligase
MDLHQFLRSRRSIRRFSDRTVNQDTITRIIHTATHAPSAHNRQPWRFAVIVTADVKARLIDLLTSDFSEDLKRDGLDSKEIEARINRSKSRMNNAPVVIILNMDMSEMDKYQDENDTRVIAERIMATQSTAAAGTYFQLAARAEGLDTVWICSPLFAPKAVKYALHLPEIWEPQAMFFLGYAAELPKDKKFKPIEEVLKFL